MSSKLNFELWDLVQVQGSYDENEWRVYNIDLDNKTVLLVSKFNREVTLPIKSIIGKLEVTK